MREPATIPISQLREPARAARTMIDDQRLAELAASIRELGLLERLLVAPLEDGTFEVLAGHRRLLAARLAGLLELPCEIEHDRELADAVRMHENLEREDLSPADEAVYYAELYEHLGQDVDAVAARVKRPRATVEARLNLLRGEPAVLEALRDGKVSLGVAEELNRMTLPQDRAFYLEHAARGGCSVRQMREWRQRANTTAELAAAKPEGPPQAGPGGDGGAVGPELRPSYAGFAQPHELSGREEARPCYCCGETNPEWRMYRHFVCVPCADRFFAPLKLDGVKLIDLFMKGGL